MVAILVVATIIVFLAIDYFVKRPGKQEAVRTMSESAKPRFAMPKGYFFGRGHTWIELLSDNLARVGLDDFAQKIIGRIDDVDFIAGDSEVAKGDKLFTVRQGEKTLSFRAPISGKVVSFNDELVSSPEVLRKKPYSDGWVAILEPANFDQEAKSLSRGNEAAQWLREEIKRFRNFITVQENTLLASPAKAGATLLDGGTPAEGVMEHSSKETWQKFEADFLANGGSD